MDEDAKRVLHDYPSPGQPVADDSLCKSHFGVLVVRANA